MRGNTQPQPLKRVHAFTDCPWNGRRLQRLMTHQNSELSQKVRSGTKWTAPVACYLPMIPLYHLLNTTLQLGWINAYSNHRKWETGMFPSANISSTRPSGHSIISHIRHTLKIPVVLLSTRENNNGPFVIHLKHEGSHLNLSCCKI